MKYTFFYFILISLFISCQSNQAIVEDGESKSEKFLAPETEKNGIIYIASEADNPGYYPVYLAEAIKILHVNKNNTWETGSNDLSSFIQESINKQSNSPDVNLRVDMQIITYINFDNFIFKAAKGVDQYKHAKDNLTLLIKHTQPIEWRILTKSLLIAKSELSTSEYEKIAKYIIDGAKKTISNPSFFSRDSKVVERLKIDATYALNELE